MRTDVTNTKPSRPWWRRRRLWWPLLALLIFFAALPALIRLALPPLAERQGLGQLQVANIDLNLFAGTAAVEGLVLQRGGRQVLAFERIAVDMDWWASLRRTGWQVGLLSLQGVELPVRERADGVWEAVVELSPDSSGTGSDQRESAAPLQFLVRQLDLRDIDIEIASSVVSGQFHIADLSLHDLSNWQLDPAAIQLTGSWQGAELTLDGQLILAGEQPDADLQLRLNAVPLAWLNPLLAPQHLTLAGALSSDLHLVWKDQRATVSGRVDLADLAVDYGKLGGTLAQGGWKGEVELSRRDGQWRPALRASIDLSELALSNAGELRLLNLASANLAGLSLSQDGVIALTRAELRGIDVVAGATADDRLMTAASDIAGLRLVPGESLSVDSASVDGADYLVILQRDGELALRSVLTGVLASLPAAEDKGASGDSGDDSETETAEASQPSEPFAIRVGQLRIGDDSRLRWRDESIIPAVRLTLGIDSASLGELDSSKPAQLSPLTFKGSLGAFSSVEVSGEVAPFAEPFQLALKGRLEAVELPQLSPYMEHLLGYDLVAGQYDHRFTLDLKGDALTMDNRLTLRQLQVARADIDPAEVSQTLPIPLDLALGLLRDRKDNIKLEVPIKGDLSNPSVGLDDIVGTALVAALRTGSVSYLALVLQPYGAVYMAADYLGGEIGKLRLEPLTMAPAADSFSGENLAYLEKIQKLLAERAGLQLKLCGIAVPADLPPPEQDTVAAEAGEVPASAAPAPLSAEQKTALRALAQARSRAAKQYLADAGVPVNRLFECKPRLDQAREAGGIDLLL